MATGSIVSRRLKLLRAIHPHPSNSAVSPLGDISVSVKDNDHPPTSIYSPPHPGRLFSASKPTGPGDALRMPRARRAHDHPSCGSLGTGGAPSARPGRPSSSSGTDSSSSHNSSSRDDARCISPPPALSRQRGEQMGAREASPSGNVGVGRRRGGYRSWCMGKCDYDNSNTGAAVCCFPTAILLVVKGGGAKEGWGSGDDVDGGGGRWGGERGLQPGGGSVRACWSGRHLLRVRGRRW